MSEPSPSHGGEDGNDAGPAGPDGTAGDAAGAPKPFDPYDDPMAPPHEPCECWCLHCERTFMSTDMWFQRVVGARDGFPGFWMCPTPNCSGAGFTFDIFPTDPDHPANAGWQEADEEEDLLDEDAEMDTAAPDAGGADSAGGEWDPAEAKYKQLDEDLAGLEDEDLEGEEWKFGLAPGEKPPDSQSDAMAAARREWEEEQKRFDQPDERPRTLDWSDRDDRSTGGAINEDDIPF